MVNNSTNITAQPIISHVSMSPELTHRMNTGLAQVEELLHRELSRGDSFLTEKTTHLLTAGGKRFRPVFTLLCGALSSSENSSTLITSAAIIELVHLATLYHDDVMDEARVRRGVPSANVRWNNTVAILAGDYLFSRVTYLLADLGPQVLRYIAEVVSTLVTGQMRETVGYREINETTAISPIEHYLQVINEKTACLIAASGQLAGIATGVNEEQVQWQTSLGHALGMAFQISDDIIDISSISSQSGKVPGTDLREGVLTLPVLYALGESGPHAAQLQELVRRPLDNEEEITLAVDLINRSQGVSLAKAHIESYITQALDALDHLPAGQANDALRQLAQSTVKRVG